MSGELRAAGEIPPPATIEEATQREIEAVARAHAKRLTAELRARKLLGEDEEIVWDWRRE